MGTLDYFDFKDEFTLHEISCLCIGVDPNGSMHLSEHYINAYRTIFEEAKKSSISANAVCARSFFDIDTHEPEGLLYPDFSRRLLAAQTLGVIKDSSKWPPPGFEMQPIEEWTFERFFIIRWLEQRNYRPIYDFTRRGTVYMPQQIQSSEEVGSSERQLSARERNSLLVIIGALLELIQTPRPNRNSQAAIINELISNYGEKEGISKANLEKKFAIAKRVLTA